MPEPSSRSEIQVAWIAFAQSTGALLVPSPDDRPLDQFLPFRDKVLALVQSEAFLKDLDAAWIPFSNSPNSEVSDALLMELRAFPLSVEVAKATAPAAGESKSWWTKWFGRASTVAGSVKDLVDNLPPWAKNAITLFEELVDLFKGKD